MTQRLIPSMDSGGAHQRRRGADADFGGQNDLFPASTEQAGEHGLAATPRSSRWRCRCVAAGFEEQLQHLAGRLDVGVVAEGHGAQHERGEPLVNAFEVQWFHVPGFRDT